MTYRNKIQSMIKAIDALYEEAETMRDLATLEEKKYWNAHRKIFYDAFLPLSQLDRSLSLQRAETII